MGFPSFTYLAPHEAERALFGLLDTLPGGVKLYQADIARWKRIIAQAGIKLNQVEMRDPKPCPQ